MNAVTLIIAAAAAVVFIAASPATAQVGVSAPEALMKKSG